MTEEIAVASVLSFEKKLAPSDGYLYGCRWSDKENVVPLTLHEKSVRGTISNRLKKALQGDPVKLNNEVDKPNLQTVDTCALGVEHDTLKLDFTLKILGGLRNPSACNSAAFKESYQQAIDNYLQIDGMQHLAKRYALNIANARFLWRNRFGAEAIQVKVSVLSNQSTLTWEFNALDFNLRELEAKTPEVDELAKYIASALASEDNFLLLGIECYAKIGRSQDVYPSEELVYSKGKEEKSKVLYSTNGIAALHSQKIGNALRTIDTWYPGYDDPSVSAGPIAIEPYGAVTTLGKAFRTPAEKQDFYSFFDQWARGRKRFKIEDEHYVVAVLVRGGVFGEGRN